MARPLVALNARVAVASSSSSPRAQVPNGRADPGSPRYAMRSRQRARRERIRVWMDRFSSNRKAALISREARGENAQSKECKEQFHQTYCCRFDIVYHPRRNCERFRRREPTAVVSHLMLRAFVGSLPIIRAITAMCSGLARHRLMPAPVSGNTSCH